MSENNLLAEPFQVLSEIVDILDALKIDYFLTGSVASGVRGEFRGTNDIDIVASLDLDSASKLVKLAASSFFADEIAIINAVREKRSFNLIHKITIIKVDIFTNLDSLNQEQLKRADLVYLRGMGKKAKVATAEDIILSKLIWYKKGGGQSERQWRDILGVIDASNEFLDLKYLQSWAKELGFTELLDKAFQD